MPQVQQQPVGPQVQPAPPRPASQTGTRGKYVPPYMPNRVPTVEGVEHIDPETVYDLIRTRSCVLIDLRGDDRAAGVIEGSVHEPAIDTVPFWNKVPGMVQKFSTENLVIFTCQYSAHRAPQCANWYRDQADPRQRVGILSGGFRGWEALGLPVQPLQQSAIDSKSADDFAMQQGVYFVRHVAPQTGHVYLQAQAGGPAMLGAYRMP